MNWQHLSAFVWLRWRLIFNQARKGGAVNAVLTVVLAIAGLFLSAGAFILFFFIGIALADAWPVIILFVWVGVVVGFSAWWASGTLIELQRADAMSLSKFLHLPVSLRGAFLLNYLSSLFSFTLVLFVPAMLALALGLATARSAAFLLLLPALFAFLLMVTAVTHQFQGWLASLMANKRHRRTILVAVTAGFVLLCQLPSLINMFGPWSHHDNQHHSSSPESGSVPKDFSDESLKHEEDEVRQQVTVAEPTIRLASMILPIGWLALAAEGIAEGHLVMPLLAMLGMFLIGSLSLWRSYRTTLRLYTGYFSANTVRLVPRPDAEVGPATGRPAAQIAESASLPGRADLLERGLPLIPSRAAAVAFTSLRSLLRAPEIKLAVLGQAIVLAIVVFANLARTSSDLAELLRPLFAAGCMLMVLITMINLIGNQFALDRNGFRAYVLSPIPRRDILLGKNLAALPMALAMPIIGLVVIEVVRPMRVDHFLAVIPQMVTMYLLFCMLANWASILAPTRLRSGTLRAANPRAVYFLLHVAFLLVLPLVVAPAFLPLLLEYVLAQWGGVNRDVPVYLLLTLPGLAIVVLMYVWCLHLQGRALQAREISILETVMVREE
jgi:hypothetical protein